MVAEGLCTVYEYPFPRFSSGKMKNKLFPGSFGGLGEVKLRITIDGKPWEVSKFA